MVSKAVDRVYQLPIIVSSPLSSIVIHGIYRVVLERILFRVSLAQTKYKSPGNYAHLKDCKVD